MARGWWLLIVVACGAGRPGTTVRSDVNQPAAAPAEAAFAATDRLDLRLPAGAKPERTHVAAMFDDGRAYKLPDGSTLVIQHRALDGECEWTLDDEASRVATHERIEIGKVRAVVARVEDRVVVATCMWPQLVVFAARSDAPERSRAIAIAAATSLHPTQRSFETKVRIPIGRTLAMYVPTPAGSLGPDLRGDTYRVPGARVLAVKLASTGGLGCERWRDDQARTLARDHRVERLSVADRPLVIASGEHLSRHGHYPNQRQASVIAAYCVGETGVSMWALSFEGGSPDREPPAATTARLRALIETTVATIEPL